MRFALALATPAFAAHTGVPRIRTGPELSDMALFAVAALGVWLVRRAMRARLRRREDRRQEIEARRLTAGD